MVTIRAVGKRVCLRDPPGWGIRDTDVEHLALENQIIQPSHDLFDRRDLVPDVHPVKIDIVGLQSSEVFWLRCAASRALTWILGLPGVLRVLRG
jgi:hypothetical protein